MPLSDLVHGIYMMTPPELLHTTDEGISEYMLEGLTNMLGEWKGVETGDTATKMKEMFNAVHLHFFKTNHRQSERNLPRGAGRTGFLKATKVGASEMRGQIFILLCISHTTQCRVPLEKLLKQRGVKYDDFLECLKLYLGMQEWFHTNNPKKEVRAARPFIGDVIERIKDVFPRTTGQGWNIPKVHGLTKMQSYMLLFGSGINFFGGPGECNHKKFVKDPANNTQLQISKFNSQLATRWYETNMFELATEAARQKFDQQYRLVGKTQDDEDEFDYFMGGTYLLQFILNFIDHSISYVISEDKPKSTKKSIVKRKVQVPRNVLLAIQLFLVDQHGWNGGSHDMVGYTSLKTKLEGRNECFRATDEFHGGSWYDWCMVEYNIDGSVSLYPSKIHAFISFEDRVFENSTSMCDEDDVFAVVQSSVQPLHISQLEDEFISSIELGFDAEVHYQVVPVESIVRPLYVFKNYNGSKKEFFCSLPRRKWARYFGDKIET